MFANGSSYHGNSFADPVMDPGGPIRPVRQYKFGVSQAAAMYGIGD